jgi:hypothetical protein
MHVTPETHVTRVLSELHSELEQIEREIRLLQRSGARTNTRAGHRPGLIVYGSDGPRENDRETRKSAPRGRES